jgi:hypothetical protein
MFKKAGAVALARGARADRARRHEADAHGPLTADLFQLREPDHDVGGPAVLVVDAVDKRRAFVRAVDDRDERHPYAIDNRLNQ